MELVLSDICCITALTLIMNAGGMMRLRLFIT